MADGTTECIAREPVADWTEIEKGLVDDIFESDEGGSVQYATPPMYVPLVGRGFRKRPGPCDIRIPRIYFKQLRQKNPSKSLRPAGRGSALKNSSQLLPGRIQTPDDPPHTSLKLNENFLGAATRGLTSEILEGKACLMEKFLGKPMLAQEGFNPFSTDQQHAPRSLRSSQTAPVLNFSSRDQWPDIGGRGACQSDCGQRGGPRCGSGPVRFRSVQDALDAINAASNCTWEKSSQDSSRKGEGNRKWGKVKRRQGVPAQDGSHDKEEAKMSTTTTSSVFDAAAHESGHGDRSSGNGLNRISGNREGAIPSGPNLIQVECLPENITEQRLTAVMYGYGPVIACKILRDNDSQKCIGIAFVRFETSEACLSAISALHGENSPFHDSSQDDEVTPKLLIHMVT